MIFFLVSVMIFDFDPFCQKVVSDFSANSNFLILCIDDTNEKIAIENDDLFVCMNRNKKISKKKYKYKVCKILKHQGLITSRDICNEEDFVYKVLYNEQVEINAKHGKDKFIEFYFNDFVLKGGISQDEKFAVVSQLFEWEIPCYIDDESGMLLMAKEQE